jgi:hypothetical protein
MPIRNVDFASRITWTRPHADRPSGPGADGFVIVAVDEAVRTGLGPGGFTYDFITNRACRLMPSRWFLIRRTTSSNRGKIARTCS